MIPLRRFRIMSILRASRTVVPAALALAWAGCAVAGPGLTSDAKAALTAACSGDLLTFCPGGDPGGKEVEECFQRHLKELSPTCSKAVAEHKAVAQSSRRERR